MTRKTRSQTHMWCQRLQIWSQTSPLIQLRNHLWFRLKLIAPDLWRSAHTDASLWFQDSPLIWAFLYKNKSEMKSTLSIRAENVHISQLWLLMVTPYFNIMYLFPLSHWINPTEIKGEEDLENTEATVGINQIRRWLQTSGREPLKKLFPSPFTPHFGNNKLQKVRQ